MSTYDVAVVGGGPGGYVAAIRAAQLGLRVLLAERDAVGGTCLNRGCVPTKALLHAASLMPDDRELARWGLRAQADPPDMGQMYARKDETVQTLRSGVARLLTANGVEVVSGLATLLGPERLRIQEAQGTREVHAKQIILATGAAPVRLTLPGFDLPQVQTSDELLSDATLPRRLVIVGGGVIGVEFAYLYGCLGTQVTVLEAMPGVLAGMDADITQGVPALLRPKGVQVLTQARVLHAQARGEAIACMYEHKGESAEVEADRILVAVGRRPQLEGLFEDREAPPLSVQNGGIWVDDQCRTSLPGVWAIGDVTGGIQLAHFASAQGVMVAELIAGHRPQQALDAVPACIYTQPEIAAVGLTEAQARERGYEVRSHKVLLSGNARHLIEGAGRSFIKLVADARHEVLLGAHLLCPRASDMIGGFAQAIVQKTPLRELAGFIQPHPSFAESIREAYEGLLGASVHEMPKWR